MMEKKRRNQKKKPKKSSQLKRRSRSLYTRALLRKRLEVETTL